MGDNDVLVVTGPGSVAVEGRPVPEPGDGEVLVETRKSLVSTGTELAVFSGAFPAGSHWDDYADYPTTTGYMNLGTVVETGDGVAAGDGVASGDGVEAGESADAGDGAESFAPGDRVVSYAPHAAYVTPEADVCYRVPDDVADDEALFFAAAEIAMHAVRRGRATWGERAAVFGLGLLGQLAVRVLHFAGVRPVVGLNRSPARVGMLPDVEGVVGVSTAADDWLAEVEAATGGDLADVVVEATGNADAIPDQLRALRRQGRFVVLGCPQGPTEFDFHDHCNWPSYELIGAHVTSHPETATPQTPWTQGRHVELFFDAVGEPAMADLGGLVTRSRPHAEAQAVFEGLADRTHDEPSVVLTWDD